ncbi:NAD-dependent epimerase/dehydratase family protein [Rugosimonospora africana]|uniref:NAD-dependent dehydratase n=1 Tax=Rugosimonospora africana TaxID=556532 RepID=A0A8J3QZJ7_9ACTN|nr:NAD(P)-dependent oxidoreductase [Rugosimonospora africana]GIH18635.1 NAD-dependent dehydratase [Rugosimonospora africana]
MPSPSPINGQRILITGAAGRIGTALRRGLARPGRVLRLLDIAPVDPAEPGENVEIVQASFTDPDAIDAACRDVDAVVHLGGRASEADWDTIRAVNIDGTARVLEAVRGQGVARVVLASSIHAAGFRSRDDVSRDGVSRDGVSRDGVSRDGVTGGGSLPADSSPRPDTFYGVSKAAVEALGSLYHSRFGIDVTCLRIGAFRPRPLVPEDLAAWLSPADAVRLFEVCLRAQPAAFRILWGISANTRRWWSLSEAEAIGYHPEDDAERYARQILTDGRFDPGEPRNHRVGGGFCTMPLG